MISVKQNSLLDILSHISRGSAKCVFADSVDDAIASLEYVSSLSSDRNTEDPFSRRFALLQWKQSPRIDRARDDVVEQLARMASRLWPHWPDSQDRGTNPEMALGDDTPGIATRWRIEVNRLCSLEQLPLPAGYSNSQQIKFLSELLGPDGLYLILVLNQLESSTEHLDGLCRLALWLADFSEAPVVLLLPEFLRNAPGLASIDYEPLTWNSETVELPEDCETGEYPQWEPAITPTCLDTYREADQRYFEATNPDQYSSVVVAEAPNEVSNTRGIRDRADESLRCFGPIVGSPHPMSPGEQRLAESIAADPMLAGLFQFNGWVRTVYGSNFIVDLLAESERVVIEVDGYRNHSGRVAFRMDRQRDYELLTSGYLVLRLPHNEVMESHPECLNKIRRVVQYARNLGQKGV